jgi:hypothetical protein
VTVAVVVASVVVVVASVIEVDSEAEVAVEVVAAKDAVPTDPRPSVAVARVANLSWTTTSSQLYEK